MIICAACITDCRGETVRVEKLTSYMCIVSSWKLKTVFHTLWAVKNSLLLTSEQTDLSSFSHWNFLVPNRVFLSVASLVFVFFWECVRGDTELYTFLHMFYGAYPLLSFHTWPCMYWIDSTPFTSIRINKKTWILGALFIVLHSAWWLALTLRIAVLLWDSTVYCCEEFEYWCWALFRAIRSVEYIRRYHWNTPDKKIFKSLRSHFVSPMSHCITVPLSYIHIRGVLQVVHTNCLHHALLSWLHLFPSRYKYINIVEPPKHS